MSLLSVLSTTSKTRESKERSIVILQELPHYLLGIGLGLLGGTLGVAVAIGLTIVVQSMLFPVMIFWPGAVPLTLMAVIAGLGVLWLISRLARLIWPDLFYISEEQGIRVMLIVSILTSLLQAILFFMH
jgi:hypothetical protein